jgi:WhiB family redox-sensing transcriptional regulator
MEGISMAARVDRSATMELEFEIVTVNPWEDEAACVGRIDLFFPKPSERPAAREAREASARRICHRCPVLIECRDFARRTHQYGFWGGENEEARVAAGFRLPAPIGVRRKDRART